MPMTEFTRTQKERKIETRRAHTHIQGAPQIKQHQAAGGLQLLGTPKPEPEPQHLGEETQANPK